MPRLAVLLPVVIAFLVGAVPALAWTWPVDGPVLQQFDLGDDVYAGGQHRGVDIGAAVGDPVVAPARGTVSFAGTVPGGGRTITIQTADGFAVTLQRLGALDVARGDAVAEGEHVATAGPARAAGEAPHVHLGIRVASDPHGYVDPLSLLPAPGGAMDQQPSSQEAAPATASEAEPAASSDVGPSEAAAGEDLGVPAVAAVQPSPLESTAGEPQAGALTAAVAGPEEDPGTGDGVPAGSVVALAPGDAATELAVALSGGRGAAAEAPGDPEAARRAARPAQRPGAAAGAAQGRAPAPARRRRSTPSARDADRPRPEERRYRAGAGLVSSVKVERRGSGSIAFAAAWMAGALVLAVLAFHLRRRPRAARVAGTPAPSLAPPLGSGVSPAARVSRATVAGRPRGRRGSPRAAARSPVRRAGARTARPYDWPL